MLKSYLEGIFRVAQQGDAREESYYSVLERLLKEYAESVGKRNIHITTLPKKTEAGNPDFKIWDGKQHKVGYIEAKSPTTEYLDQIETTEQLDRYIKTFPNLILTNFFEFRLYRNGNLIDKVRIGRPFVLHKLKTIPPVEKEIDFIELLEKFFSFSLPKVYNAKTLAIELAKMTSFLKDEVITHELKEEESQGKGFISGFYEAFKKYLISGLTKEDFVDIYSQTITYGLFAARTRSEHGFNRKLAYDNIPRTIGILRDIFQFISIGKIPLQMECSIDDISEVLEVTDVKNILHQYFHEGKGKDPIVHFYETFLTKYNPAKRKEKGVYYTPESVVSYIVRSLHNILKEHFNRADGFASESVTILDPAAGTLTFLAEAAKLAVEEFVSKYGEGGKENFIKEHILKNFYAFELMMASYAVGHLKMSFLLEELGYKLQEDDRFKLYLTNTLEMEELAQTELPGMTSLSEESHLAGKVKKEQPILVILGNPPYSGISTNPSEKYITIRTKDGKERRKKIKTWIGNLIEDYKYVDGKHFGERKHWLHDDYVKFIRFAQWKIEQAGEGVLGFITNHGYLDNVTFRGMRQSLMNSFNEIYVLDLHGYFKKNCPDGSKDGNVFKIQQGVAIALFIKNKSEEKECKIYHSEIWGLEEKKYIWLLKNDIKKTKWKRLNPTSPNYFFVPRKEKGREIYEKYRKLTDIFPVNITGVVTAMDKFVIDYNRQSLQVKIRTFIDEKNTDDYIKEFLRSILGRKKIKDVENYGWRVSKSRQELRKVENLEDYFTKILYRPFDVRKIFFHDSVVWRTRKKVMRHMMQENLGIHTCRQISSSSWQHILVSNGITDDCYVSNRTRERGYLFPLYFYQRKGSPKKASSGSTMMMFEPRTDYEARKPNLSQAIVNQLKKAFKKTPSPEQIFYYIYAVLYSNIYRTKYAEFLKIDFPRVPFTKDYKLLSKMAKYGKRLVYLHLLKSTEIDSPVAKFQGKGNNKVEKLRYDEKGKRVYFNQSQYFEGIAKQVWQYQIGGYQVCYKWLKDRKGRKLSLDDIKHYCKIVTSLQKTIKIQEKIDNTYPGIEKEIIEF